MDLFWIQAVGFLAFFIEGAFYFCKSSRIMMKVSIVTSVLWTAHYLLLGVPSAGLYSFLSTIRSFAGGYLPEKWMKGMVWGISILLVVLLLTLYQGIIAALICASAVVNIGICYMRDRRLAFLGLTASAYGLWVAVALYSGSLAGLAGDGTMFCVVLIAFIRALFDLSVLTCPSWLRLSSSLRLPSFRKA